ncbi:hypothetical protein SAMN02787142_2440 [Burkholderia sp. WP9]|uniref:hypothetical protein n=1 Tax=Burkholderia sp. WP9 TaxID=1500263 RepID=UPI00089960E3|nr:hypothetical protein [Burkholderia sp. WP9]SED04835.1 hypothetical protein SAMN02787142_2440 [Burkholderia sp. WP9]
MTHNGLLRPVKKRSCYLIAFLYEKGLAEGNWTTQAGALNALGVSRAELSLALKLDVLPDGLMELFERPAEITPYSVRVIREVIARDGLEIVGQRIGQHVAAGSKFSGRAVLAMVKGQVSASKRALPWPRESENRILKRTLDLPRTISDRYHLGVTRGEWTSYSGCSRALNISRKNIRDAVYIKALRDSLPALFSETELTFAVGRKLLALDKEWGREALLQRARGVRSEVKGATAETVLREFNGENVQPSDFSRVRIRKGRGTKRLIIECDHAEFLFRYRRELEIAIRSVVKKLTVSPGAIELARFLHNHPGFKKAQSSRVSKAHSRL